MDAPVLSIQHLCAEIGSPDNKHLLLNDISLSVYAGETLALVGESGSGKSVTALSILRLLNHSGIRYSSGEIIFNDRNNNEVNLLQLKEKELNDYRGKEIGFVFQEPMNSLNPLMTCGKQITEVLLKHTACSKKEAASKALELLRKVELPHPERFLDAYPHELSGGQKQRVMIAMAISCNPRLLIADEPTTALDVTVQKSILQLLQSLQKSNGMALLFITHDLGIVSELADRVAVLYRGELLETRPVTELFSHPHHPYTKALLACRPILFEKGQTLPTISELLTHSNNPVTAAVKEIQAAAIPPAETLLSVQNLTVSFGSRNFLGKKKSGSVVAVDQVSFDIFQGETLGLVGESGCGKTTLGRTLLRLQQAESGSIIFHGKEDLLKLPLQRFRSHRKELQIVFQDPYASLNPRMRIGDMLLEPVRLHRPDLSKEAAKVLIRTLLQKVGLPEDSETRYPHAFSGGQRQRLVIARALAVKPAFIVWDESVSALDVSIQAQILNLINELKDTFKFTSLFISHDLSVVRYLCDRILIMQKGRIVESGLAEQIWNTPRHPYTRELLDAIPGQRQLSKSE
jgi:peptide/nickel transport system ATP-binding protein